MIYLVDTNVLLRFSDRIDPLHSRMRASVRRLRADGHSLQTTVQNRIEFWNVLTRPRERNGLGQPLEDAHHWLRVIERLFPLIPDSPAVYPHWRRLVMEYRVSGVQVHDARLVATMKVHAVMHILTLNTRDFTRYAREGIIASNPVHIAATP